MLLGALDRPADAPALLRELRTGGLHPRVHPRQPVVTIWAADEVSTLRAYDAGSDHHLPTDSGYLVVRAVIAAVTRRVLEPVVAERLQMGALHIDVATRTVDIAGTTIEATNLEFELLRHLAARPARVFAKDELIRAVWGARGPVSVRTVDSHMTRLRGKLTAAGAGALLQTTRGVGWRLVDPTEA